jgi:hypothetical protein
VSPAVWQVTKELSEDRDKLHRLLVALQTRIAEESGIGE